MIGSYFLPLFGGIHFRLIVDNVDRFDEEVLKDVDEDGDLVHDDTTRMTTYTIDVTGIGYQSEPQSELLIQLIHGVFPYIIEKRYAPDLHFEIVSWESIAKDLTGAHEHLISNGEQCIVYSLYNGLNML